MDRYHKECNHEEGIERVEGGGVVRIIHCFDHNVDCCICGWEWEHHYNTHSPDL